MTTGISIVEIRDWASIRSAFESLFEGIGELSITEERVEFQSRAPLVVTGLVLYRDGRLQASMPLHGVEARAERVEWAADRAWVRFIGPYIDYTYRVPPQLITLRVE